VRQRWQSSWWQKISRNLKCFPEKVQRKRMKSEKKIPSRWRPSKHRRWGYPTSCGTSRIDIIVFETPTERVTLFFITRMHSRIRACAYWLNSWIPLLLIDRVNPRYTWTK
jgi:hypothetical protein